jgi:hypothetical protein
LFFRLIFQKTSFLRVRSKVKKENNIKHLKKRRLLEKKASISKLRDRDFEGMLDYHVDKQKLGPSHSALGSVPAAGYPRAGTLGLVLLVTRHVPLVIAPRLLGAMLLQSVRRLKGHGAYVYVYTHVHEGAGYPYFYMCGYACVCPDAWLAMAVEPDRVCCTRALTVGV